MEDEHLLLIYRSPVRQWRRTAGWIADALAREEKVYCTHRPGDDVLARLTGGTAPESVDLARGTRELLEEALRSGRLELLDAAHRHDGTGGDHRALRDRLLELVERARADGHAGVAMTADEVAMHILAPDPAELVAHERDLARLAAGQRVRLLCRYQLDAGPPGLLTEVAGAHGGVDDLLWSAQRRGDRLLVCGEVDAADADRFAAVLAGAVREGVASVDLAGARYLSAAGIAALEEAARLRAGQGGTLELTGVPPLLRNALEAVGLTERVPALISAAPPDGSCLPAEELAEVTQLLLKAGSVAEVLQRIADAALLLVPGADVVSFTLREEDGTLHTPVQTSPAAGELDRVQYEIGEGPCLDAVLADGPAFVESTGLADEPRWPRFGPVAAGHGMNAVLTTALIPGPGPEVAAGALNLYSRGTGGWDAGSRDVALVLAGHASLALAGLRARDAADLAAADLRRAIDSRDVIGQAKGILMSRRGITAEEAFALLSRTSQNLNVKLADLARVLAERPGEVDLPDG
ncbi:ANTAR domain-containing protein [Actinomadura macrotermitis]|uniref:ANTAR domain-containing protein n=1 Tax=Actinomadura macrotermitis TaxID=2585200 RepID=A0A7K0BU42_9ACTN|nr:ANTAR domain-containing protein [Actinomadura macrotermitis]MQY04689.1 hypothetical protein [Actinomadura macrotermitis]